MKKILDNKSIILIAICVVVVIIGFILLFNVVKRIFGDNSSRKEIERSEVMALYDNLSNISCYNSLVWEIDGKVKTEDMDNKILLDLVFRSLDKEGNLSDELSLRDFEKAKDSILGSSFKELKVKDHQYGGYIYNTKNNKIVREAGKCSDNEYVSIMNGYSNDNNKLVMNVNVGYVDGKEVYDLEDNSLGEYSKEKLGEVLTKGTGYKYTFNIEDDNYYLVSVENIEKKVIEKE